MAKLGFTSGAKTTAAAADDEQQLVAVYRDFFPKVVKFMYCRVGAAQAEDLASEVFLRVVRHLPRQNGSLKAWIYRISSNVAIDYLKSAPKRREISVDPQDQEELLDGKTEAPLHGVRIDLQRALTKLTDEQREVVTQKFLIGLTTREIEEITGRKPEAIRALQFRALKALRGILAEEEGKT